MKADATVHAMEEGEKGTVTFSSTRETEELVIVRFLKTLVVRLTTWFPENGKYPANQNWMKK